MLRASCGLRSASGELSPRRSRTARKPLRVLGAVPVVPCLSCLTRLASRSRRVLAQRSQRAPASRRRPTSRTPRPESGRTPPPPARKHAPAPRNAPCAPPTAPSRTRAQRRMLSSRHPRRRAPSPTANHRATIAPLCGRNSVGRVSASQAECRGFEPRRPLHLTRASVATYVVARARYLAGSGHELR